MKGLFNQGKKTIEKPIEKPNEKPKDQKPLPEPKTKVEENIRKFEEKKSSYIKKPEEKKELIKPIEEKKTLQFKQEEKKPVIKIEEKPEENKRSSIEDELKDLVKEIKKDSNATVLISPRKESKSPINLPKDAQKIDRPEDEILQKELREELKKSDKKLDIQTPNEPLFLAIHDENIQDMEELIKKDPTCVNKSVDEGITPLMFASVRNFIPGIELLLKKEAKVDTQTTAQGFTALHYATFKGNRESVHILLENGAKLKDKGGYTPLMSALFKKQYIIAYDLLLYGQNINEKNENGMSALHLAVLRKDHESFDFLIKIKANVNIKDSNGNSPLFIAIQTNNRDVLKKLVDVSECDWTIKNNRGQTIFHYAILARNATLIDFLYSIKKDLMSKLINEVDSILGRTPIFYSVVEYDKILSFLIIQPQVNLNIQDQNGDTVLHLAIKLENVASIRLLMNGPNAANVEIKNNEKQSAKMLLKSKPDLNKKLTTEKGKGFASADHEL